MGSEAICDCGMDLQAVIEWHKTTEGHLWNKLKKELDGNYLPFAKKKIPEGARCDICGVAAHLRRVKGKWSPKWYVVDNEDKPAVRCRKCKRDRHYLIKSQFVKLLKQNGALN